MYRYEVKYMVNGCGKKIQSTRTVVVYDGDRVIAEEKTQEDIRTIKDRYENFDTAPDMSSK